MLQYLFPRSIWLHPSAVVDYQIFFINNLIKFFLIVPFLMTHVQLMWVIVRFWEEYGGEPLATSWAAWQINIAYTIVFLLVSDFSRFLIHWSMHKVPFLWQFHKVHHAAEVLTPMTLYRIHPLEYFVYKLRSVVVFAVVAGTFYFWFRSAIVPWTILKIHAGIFVFNLLGANLRHSHIPISFGRWLEHLLISPAQHQIHHGQAPQYYDKNFGSMFAFWDWLFGSLVISHQQQRIAFGIEQEEQRQMRSLWQNLWAPIRRFFKG